VREEAPDLERFRPLLESRRSPGSSEADALAAEVELGGEAAGGPRGVVGQVLPGLTTGTS
jgi:hypothetical protein